jgi:DNA-binding NarL/FixJ family response regulator
MLHSTEDKGNPRKLVVIAVLGDEELSDEKLHVGTIGFILPGDDQAGLMRTLEDLRVNVQLRPECACASGHQLSPRELDVLRALVDGMSNKMIAAELRISFETVRSHMKCIYQKLKVNNNTAAVAKAIHEGMLLQDTVA